MALKCPECGAWRKTAYGLYCHLKDSHGYKDEAFDIVGEVVEESKESKVDDDCCD